MSGEVPSALRAGSPTTQRKAPVRESWTEHSSTSPPPLPVPPAGWSQSLYDPPSASTHEPTTLSSQARPSQSAAYAIPRPPEVPRLAIPALTSPYTKTPTEDPSDPWAVHHAQPKYKTQRNRSLISRGIGTIKSLASPASSASRYGALHDDHQDDPRQATDDEEHYDVGGVDISALEGPFALQSMSGAKSSFEETRIQMRERLDSGSSSGDEINRQTSRVDNKMLKVRTDSTILGSGMRGVVDASSMEDEHLRTPLKSPAVERNKSTLKSPAVERSKSTLRSPAVERSKSTMGRMRSMIHRGKSHRDPSSAAPEAEDLENPAHMEAQKAADEKGEILAVTEEVPVVDISGLSGSGLRSSTTFDSMVDNKSIQLQKSYFFPEDPEQPSWRPFSMHWAWIGFLTVSALFLAGFQEFVCQYSLKKEAEGSGVLVFTRPQEISTADYFAWKYAPTMLLVTYGVLWQISDYEVKRLEPYYQLSKRTGATAAESINMDYLTFFSYLSPLKAIRHRHWAVAVSSSAYLLASSLVPILQSASVNMYPAMDDRRVDKPKYVRIDPGWSRGLTVALACNAICGIVLLFQLRRKSGLLSDPKGIAGIAAMATRSHILEDFRGLDTAPHHVIHKQLRHRRYILHKSSLWQGEYITATDRRGTWDESKRRSKKPENPHPLMLRLPVGGLYIGCLVIFAILIPVFVFTPAMMVTEKLPWLLTTLATFVKLAWGTLDGDVRMMEPFYILSRHQAPPRTLTLDYTGTIPGWLSIKALINKHYLVALVGLGAILTEVLTVCVSSFGVDGSKFFPDANGHDPAGQAANPDENRYNSDETFKSFWVSFALALGILFVLAGTAALVYARRRHPFLPREPGTIASVLAFIHQSKCLADFVGTERLESRAMTAALDGLGKTYALGWFYGRDGDFHCGIDEDPVQEYRHGDDPEAFRLLPKHIGTFDHY